MAAAMASSAAKSTILQNPVFPRDPSSSFFGVSVKGLCAQQRPRNKSRDGLSLVVASANPTSTTGDAGRFYFNFTGFPFPLGPFLNRRTIRTEVSSFFLPYTSLLIWKICMYMLFPCFDFCSCLYKIWGKCPFLRVFFFFSNKCFKFGQISKMTLKIGELVIAW